MTKNLLLLAAAALTFAQTPASARWNQGGGTTPNPDGGSNPAPWPGPFPPPPPPSGNGGGAYAAPTRATVSFPQPDSGNGSGKFGNQSGCGCTGSVCVACNEDTTPPNGDPSHQTMSRDTSGESGSEGGAAPRQPGGGGDGAQGVFSKYNRNDILPGQMDAMRAGGLPAIYASVLSPAPEPSVNLYSQIAPIGSSFGRSGPSRGRTRGLLAEARNRTKLRDFRGAAALAAQAAAQDPDSARAQLALAQAANRLGDGATAEQAASASLRLNPMDPAAWQARCWALVHQKRYQEAKQAADQAVALAAHNAAAYAARAAAQAGLGDRPAALADLKQAAAIDPRFLGRYESALEGKPLDDSDDDYAELNDEMAAPRALAADSTGLGLGVIVLLGVGGLIGFGFSRKARAPYEREAIAA